MKSPMPDAKPEKPYAPPAIPYTELPGANMETKKPDMKLVEPDKESPLADMEIRKVHAESPKSDGDRQK